MALTFSRMFPLAKKAPDFNLPDTVSGRKLSFSDAKGEKATVVMFICNHCPYVIHIKKRLTELSSFYQKKGIGFVAISSNDAENFPQDGPDKMREDALAYGYPFPYLFDETQQVAKAFMAACTPDFYVFDAGDTCVYRGRFDDSNHKNGKEPSGADLQNTLDAILNGKELTEPQEPSSGCNIKWKAGVSPF